MCVCFCLFSIFIYILAFKYDFKLIGIFVTPQNLIVIENLKSLIRNKLMLACHTNFWYILLHIKIQMNLKLFKHLFSLLVSKEIFFWNYRKNLNYWRPREMKLYAADSWTKVWKRRKTLFLMIRLGNPVSNWRLSSRCKNSPLYCHTF